MAYYEISHPIQAKDFLKGKIAFPCSGNGTCGKCKIKVTGDTSPLTSMEEKLLTDKEIKEGVRLACYTEFLSAGTIETFEATQLVEGASDTTELINTTLNYVCGIDIGTTTIACVIYSAKTGKRVAEVLEENAQRSYGADVISRIEACKEYGTDTIQQVIRTQLDRMYCLALNKADIPNVDKTVITGNTTMLHILEGLNPETLGVTPFTVVSLFGTQSDYLDAYLPHCVSAYVGADLLCAALASKMIENPACSLLVDIGTNGEMCISENGELTCCSVAAGPAFEGCGLSCGTPAIEGAITHVELKNNKPIISTIGTTMTSICGSGIISLIHVMLELELIDETGKFTDEVCLDLGTLSDGKFYIQESDVYITGEDISKVQLAKSAICAGIYTLLGVTSTSIDSIDTLYICGGFGAHLDIPSACGIGLIPNEFLDKVKVLGNAALTGAVNIALGTKEIAPIYKEVNLSNSPLFMDYYIDCMLFE